MSDTIFAAVLIVPTLALAIADVAERWLPAHEPRRAPGNKAGLAFLAAVLVVYQVIQLALQRLAPQPLTLVRPSDVPAALAVVVGLYVGGLVDYLVHRFVSHSRAFFWTHEYHHLPSEVMLLMPGLAARPFAIVAAFPVAWATGWVAGSADAMKALVVAQVLLLVTSHSSFLRRFRWVHVVMSRLGLTTPREHLLHHTTDLRGNYANLTTVWDRVFGTYLDPDTHEARELGLPYDQDWLGAITLGLVKLPRSWRERFDIGRWCNLRA